MSGFHPFKDMAESARAQHEVDKANFEAVKAESKVRREEAKLKQKERKALEDKNAVSGSTRLTKESRRQNSGWRK